jgi:cytoskeletal protein CcmA (bactofilin family)
MHAEYFSVSLNINGVFLGDINVDEQVIFKEILKQTVNVEPIFIRFSGSLL